MNAINFINNAALILAFPLGVATGLLRNRRFLPAAIRLAPFLLVCAVVVIDLAVPLVSLITGLLDVRSDDAASKATILAAVTSALMSCTLAAGMLALAFVAGLIPTLVIVNLRKPGAPPPT